MEAIKTSEFFCTLSATNTVCKMEMRRVDFV